jgi:hypothetical protein
VLRRRQREQESAGGSRNRQELAGSGSFAVRTAAARAGGSVGVWKARVFLARSPLRLAMRGSINRSGRRGLPRRASTMHPVWSASAGTSPPASRYHSTRSPLNQAPEWSHGSGMYTTCPSLLVARRACVPRRVRVGDGGVAGRAGFGHGRPIPAQEPPELWKSPRGFFKGAGCGPR